MKKGGESFFSLKLHEQKEQNFVMIREVRKGNLHMGYIEELRKVVGTRPLILVGSAIIILNDNQKYCFNIVQIHMIGVYLVGRWNWAKRQKKLHVELFEETGLTAKIMQFLGVLSGKSIFPLSEWR